MKSWLCVALAVLAAAAGREATAAITIQDGIPWVYSIGSQYYARWETSNTGFSSTGAAIIHGPGRGNVTIPSDLDGYPVTDIGPKAFYMCSNLTSVTIPNSVTNIWTDAFSGCTGLKTLCLPLSMVGTSYVGNSGVPSTCAVLYGDAWEEVGGLPWSYVVENGKATVTAGPRQGAVTIPSVLGGHPVTGIEGSAFYNCTNLTSVTIPDSVTIIGEATFYQCSGLTNLAIGDSVTNIGNRAFRGCSRLTSVVMPDSVASIGEAAFYNCSGLTNLAIGNSVTTIGDYTFCGCSRLTSVTIPDSVASIGSYAFSKNPEPHYYSSQRLTTVDIGNGVINIGSDAFYDCTNLTAVTIHDLKMWCEIDFGNSHANPLLYARHLYLDGEEVSGDLVIPDGTKTIGREAFYFSTNLMSVTIPDSVTSIGEWAFSYCIGLMSVDIGNGVTNIGDQTFINCCRLSTLTIPDNVTSIGEWAFSSCSGLMSVDIGNGVTNIGSYAFAYSTNLTVVTMPDSVTDIGTNAFCQCSGLKTLYAPASWESKYVNGTFWSNHVRVPSGCEIVYYEPEAPTATTTGVPHSWLAEYGLGDGTEEGYESAANDKAANGRKVWECYVLGLDPREEDKDFTVAISFPDGPLEPKIEWNPDLNENGMKDKRVYEVEGAPTMTNDWGATNASSRFFRVKVAMPE